MKYFLITILFLLSNIHSSNTYPWLSGTNSQQSIAERIEVPEGYSRISVEEGSFGHWLRNLPLKPEGTPVRLWNGESKGNQYMHAAVVDIDFIGKNLQQCVDALIRLRAEYLWSIGRADEIAFTYSCCREAIPWKKWKAGWRTKVVKKNGLDAFEWVKSASFDDSRANFRKYLFNIMLYAGTWSLSKDLNEIDADEVTIGDAYIEGGAPGFGHGVMILDIAKSATGKRIMLLGQSYNPAEDFNVLKSTTDISPWFYVDFNDELITPQWDFKKKHARRF